MSQLLPAIMNPEELSESELSISRLDRLDNIDNYAESVSSNEDMSSPSVFRMMDPEGLIRRRSHLIESHLIEKIPTRARTVSDPSRSTA